MIKIIKKSSAQPESEKEIQTKKILSKMRRQSEEERASVFAASINFPYIDTNLVPIANEAIKTLTEEDSKKYNLAIIQKVAKTITAVSTDPTNQETINFIRKLIQENGWQIKIFVVSHTNMERIWEKYRKIVFVDYLDQMSVNLTGEELEKFEEELKDLISLKQRINELSTTQVIDTVMAGAFKLNASDIHLEPQEKEIRLRYRIDGILQDIAFFPLNAYKSVLSRIKMMGKMKINVRDIAQDGTFSIKIQTKEGAKKIDTRVSIIPGNFGESAVIRLLNPDSINARLESLGLQGLAYTNSKANSRSEWNDSKYRTDLKRKNYNFVCHH